MKIRIRFVRYFEMKKSKFEFLVKPRKNICKTVSQFNEFKKHNKIQNLNFFLGYLNV